MPADHSPLASAITAPESHNQIPPAVHRDRASTRTTTLAEELAGLDALETHDTTHTRRLAALWSLAWPRLAAVTLFVAFWQTVVWTGWRPSYVLPGPGPVASRLRELTTQRNFWTAVTVTARRAVTGFAVATAIGSIIGIATSRFRTLRAGIGSFITGLQTMPSIAWFPLAVLLFKLSEAAILFVVVLGAAPSIANGLLTGVDHVPPLLQRAGRVIGAKGVQYYRHVIIPAALPGYVGGLKQGWAFAWRSLMAGELLVIIANRPSLGARLQFARELSDAPGLLALMIVILIIGILVDTAFTRVDLTLRQRRGLAPVSFN